MNAATPSDRVGLGSAHADLRSVDRYQRELGFALRKGKVGHVDGCT
jgi:hypothetical protein